MWTWIKRQWRKLLITLGVVTVVLAAPVVPEDLIWVQSYATQAFNTSSGDLEPGQYSLNKNATAYLYRPNDSDPDEEQYKVASLSKDNFDPTEYEFVELAGTNYYDEFEDSKGNRYRYKSDKVSYEKLGEKNTSQPKKTINKNLISATGAEAAITPGTSTSTTGFNITSYSFSNTVDAGSDLFLFVVLGGGDFTPANCGASTVTYDGVSLTQSWSVDNGVWPAVDGWYLVNPSTGSNTVQVNLVGECLQPGGGATPFSGVDQTTPVDTPNTDNDTGGTTASVTVSSATGDLVIGGLGSDSDADITPGGTGLWEEEAIDDDVSIGAQYYSGSATVNVSWSQDDEGWAIGGVSINPAGAEEEEEDEARGDIIWIDED